MWTRPRMQDELTLKTSLVNVLGQIEDQTPAGPQGNMAWALLLGAAKGLNEELAAWREIKDQEFRG